MTADSFTENKNPEYGIRNAETGNFFLRILRYDSREVHYSMIYTEITNDIRIIVQPKFVEQDSDLIAKRFVFIYFITIENMGQEPVQLMRRYWYIQDSVGEDHEVSGDGVIGKQPKILPGEAHNYNSFCVLKSFEGSMEGHYEMRREDGSRFRVVIPRFLLKAHLLN